VRGRESHRLTSPPRGATVCRPVPIEVTVVAGVCHEQSRR
jgi:hypothetical protein